MADPALRTTYATTPAGNVFRLVTRPEVNDEALVNGILGTDEYQLREVRDLTGWALDIGAHVGTVALALAADHPGLSIVAVEPVPDNAALLRRSVEDTDLGSRVHVVEASLGPVGRATQPCRFGYVEVDAVDESFVTQNAMIGNIWRLAKHADAETIDSPVVTLEGLRERFGVDRWAFVKIDCEGCEWEGLREGVDRIDLMVGEWHDAAPERIARQLAATHDVTVITDYGGSGIFRAVHR